MITIGVHEAKTNLSELLRRVDMGEEFLITKNGREIARLSRPKKQNLLEYMGEVKNSFKIGKKKVTLSDIQKWKKEGRK